MTEFTPECLKKASAWMSNAEEDLGVAYEMFNEERYAWSIFVAATAVEKSVKAVIFLFEEEPLYMNSHDVIRYFHRAVEFAPELKAVEASIGVFGAYDSFLRYPEDHEFTLPSSRFGQEEAKDTLEAANQILPAARDIINKTSEIIRQSIV